MNFLFLLLGLLGLGAASSGGGSNKTTPSDDGTLDGTIEDPVVEDDDDTETPVDDDDDTDTPDNETPASAAITLVVYDADGNVLREIADGDSLDFGTADVSGYKIGAIIEGSGYTSVLFNVGGETFTQNIAPYDISAIDLSDGTYDITVTVHSDFSGGGDLLATETFGFDTTAETGDMDDDTETPVDDDDDTETPVDDNDDTETPVDDDDDTETPVDDDDDDGMDHGDGHDDTDDDDHGGHDVDHGTPDIPPPGVGASQSEINAFVSALKAAPEVHVHDASSSKAPEHSTAMELVDRSDATHIAIGDGDWSDPDIWAGGKVPGDNAKVLIPDGVTVSYSSVSDARLFTVRVDGALDFATHTDSQMIFDTMVVSPTGHLIIGTEDDPVDPDVTVDLIVANNGPIDTDWDPMLLSRGLISHGEATIHGATKDSHDKVTDDPMEGDTSIKMAGGVPEGWQVGDKIVIAGTHFEGYHWSNVDERPENSSEDEIRFITKIDSNGTIHFDEPLEHDHDSPRDDLKTSVANYTRNVSIETENGADAEVYERGHVMFMHSDNVDVRYMEFTELGRTDKSEEANDISDIDNVRYDSNVQGRYSVHLHRTGASLDDNPTVLEGNAVFGSPGWGFVHHDSHAVLTNNASYDTFGAGFVAETGNETGLWEDNIAIFAEGTDWAIPKNTADTEDDLFDIAKGGDGFWFQGRMVGSVDNVAASVNTGFVYFHRDGNDTMIPISADQFDYPAAMFYDERMWADNAPILSFSGNETFAAREGLHVVKANPNQEHDVHSHLDDFTAWSVVSGAHLEYTSHYILTDFDLVGKEPGAWPAMDGISIGNNTSDLTIINANIEGFDVGIDLNKSFNDTSNSKDLHDYNVIDATFKDVGKEYGQYDPRYDTILDSSDLPNYAPELDIDGRITYNGSDTYITGTKTDSLGKIDYPAGLDRIRLQKDDMQQLLEHVGYWETSGGERYTLADLYFTDRVTGEIYYETHPVYIGGSVRLGSSDFSDSVYNGVQNITTVGGAKMAGDHPLDVPIEAVPVKTSQLTHSAMPDDHDDHSMMMAAQSPSLEIDDTIFINEGDMSDMDLAISGGSTVLATGGAEFELSEGRTLSIFDAAAEVGFDGEDGGIALLDMEEGATVAFSAESGDLGTIEEYSSGAYGDTPDVLSGIDLGKATLSIDLAGLDSDAGSIFTLMDADEIVGLFGEVDVNGLGARDAKIVIDYEADSVALELSAGEGAVTTETVGEMTDATSGEEALWEALTADQGVVSDDDHGMHEDDEEEMMDHAA